MPHMSTLVHPQHLAAQCHPAHQMHGYESGGQVIGCCAPSGIEAHSSQLLCCRRRLLPYRAWTHSMWRYTRRARRWRWLSLSLQCFLAVAQQLQCPILQIMDTERVELNDKGEPLEAVLTGSKRHPNLVATIAWCGGACQSLHLFWRPPHTATSDLQCVSGCNATATWSLPLSGVSSQTTGLQEIVITVHCPTSVACHSSHAT